MNIGAARYIKGRERKGTGEGKGREEERNWKGEREGERRGRGKDWPRKRQAWIRQCDSGIPRNVLGFTAKQADSKS